MSKTGFMSIVWMVFIVDSIVVNEFKGFFVIIDISVSSINLNKIEYRFGPSNSLHFSSISMRRYKWEEDDECRKQALNSVDKCSSDCGYKLAPIGGDIQDMMDCFSKQGPAIQTEDVCLRQKIFYKRCLFSTFHRINLIGSITCYSLRSMRQCDSLNAIFKCVHDLTDRKTLISFVKDCVGAYSLF
ncbi:unnamed protein product [Brugia timori]|uniref:DUF19 domain-containing protein n=1 Tax=Brugia timori TaxID=42155 RepID=A0A0R3R283_9BILA|nr:unnamed protein product [Brugia timori]